MFNVLAIINKIRGFMGYTYLSKMFNYFFQFFMTFLVKNCLPHVSIFKLLYLSEQLPKLVRPWMFNTAVHTWAGKIKVLHSLTQISLTETKKMWPCPFQTHSVSRTKMNLLTHCNGFYLGLLRIK